MTHQLAYYHHPLDKRYSIDYVTDDAADFAESYTSNDPAKVKAVGYPFSGATGYCLYTPTGVFGTADDLDTSEEEITAALDEMDPDIERPIAIGILSAWDGVRQEEESTGRELEVYKPMQIEKIPDALEQVNWDGTATDVAGEIMSNLIIRHVLPNANHRCSISMLQIYLDYCTFGEEIEYNSLRLHTDNNEWKDWVDPYIKQSKRIITVRRNNLWFKNLRSYGCKTVFRKGGIGIELADWELDMHYHQAWKVYSRKHEKLCTRFAEEVSERAGVLHLNDQQGLDQEEFAMLLEGDD